MYTIAFGSVIGAMIGSILFGTMYAGIIFSGAICALFGALFGAVFGAYFGLIAALYVISCLVPMKNVVSKPIKLVAMRNANGISGTFILGSGEISNRTTYNFMQLEEDGSRVPGWLPANHLVHLIEDAKLKNTGSWSTTSCEADKNSPLYRWAVLDADIVRQEFRVPVGTVVQQFSID